MKKIGSFKNPKMDHCVHLYKVLEREGSQLGLLIRLEAKSFRSNFSNGTNDWDVFFLVSSYTDADISGVCTEKVEEHVSSAFPENGVISRYDGYNFYLRETRERETVLGTEFYLAPLELMPVSFGEATPEELLAVADTVEVALGEGFGPHGEYKNAVGLEAWAKDTLSKLG